MILLFTIMYSVNCNSKISKGFTNKHKYGKLKLYIINDNLYISPIDISVELDDKLIINNEYFYHGNHNYKIYDFKLLKGEHSLIVKSNKGKAMLGLRFETYADEHEALLSYEYDKDSIHNNKHFSFTILSTGLDLD